MPSTRHVRATYDPEAGVWWAEGDDVTGLVSEAPTLDGLMERVLAVAGELMLANGEPSGEITLEFTATRQIQMV